MPTELPNRRVEPAQERPFWRQVLWFVALWAAGVGVVGTVAYLIRLWIAP